MGSNVYYFGCRYYLFWKVFFFVFFCFWCLSLSNSLRLILRMFVMVTYVFEACCGPVKAMFGQTVPFMWYLQQLNDILTCTSVCFCFISFFSFTHLTNFCNA